MSRRPEPIPDRLLRNCFKHSSGCWIWTGEQSSSGYGVVLFSRSGKRWREMAHRVSYKTFNGPIPEGMQIDHLCRVILCINPAHLEAVTPSENVRRSTSTSAINAAKTHCKRGHEFTAENTAWYVNKNRKQPLRVCKACSVFRNEMRRQRIANRPPGTCRHCRKPNPTPEFVGCPRCRKIIADACVKSDQKKRLASTAGASVWALGVNA